MKKNNYIYFLLPIILILCGVVFYSIFLLGGSFLTSNKWKDQTSPLEEEVIKDLCIKLDIPSDDVLCNMSQEVYGPDFFQITKATLLKNQNQGLTFDEINTLLEPYFQRCETLTYQENGKQYYRCWYDFRGDDEFPMVFFFYKENNRLFRMINNLDYP